MPQIALRLKVLLFALLGTASAASAAPQGGAWPCQGWNIESGVVAYGAAGGPVIVGDVAVRPVRYYVGPPTALLEGVLELHRYDAHRDRFVLAESLTFPEWRSLRSMQEVGLAGRTLALQPWLFLNYPNRCDVVELLPGGPRLSSVPSSGFRMFSGRLTAVVDDTVFAVEHDGAGRIRLNVIEKDLSGSWAVEQTLEASGVRFGYPPEENVWVSASDGCVVVASDRLMPGDVAAAAFERQPDGTWVHAGNLPFPAPQESRWRVGSCTALALDGSRALLAFRRYQQPATAWLYERVGAGTWRVVQSFDGPGLTGDIALGGGRLALTRGSTTELYELDSSGRFALSRRFHGLENVFHLDEARIGGQTELGTAVRLVPFGSGSPAEIQVCQERGVVVCEAADPLAPRLRAFLEFSPWPEFRPRLAVGIERARPGEVALALRGYDIGWNPAAGGTLCIDARTAIRSTPATVDSFGRAAIEFDVSSESLATLFPMPLFVQALVVGQGTMRATDAVRLIP